MEDLSMRKPARAHAIRTLAFLILILRSPFTGIQSPAQVNEQSARLPKDKTVVDMTGEELLQYYPSELRNLKFTSDQSGMDVLLGRIGERVQAFFQDFSNTSSKENVVLQILNYNGGIDSSRIQEFRYLTLYHPQENRPLLEEYRTDTKNRPINAGIIADFFMTSGYACFSLNFHPVYRDTSRFRYLGRQTSPADSHVIAFAQKSEMGGLPVVYADRGTGKIFRFPVQGLAWIAPDTYQILRLRIDLVPSSSQSSIKEQTTEVQFSEVQFDDTSKKLWLPREVVVTTKIEFPQHLIGGARTPAIRWVRNVHRYSDYKLFEVASDYKIAQPKSAK
jgi:hypothetical protein